jgi:hypothetical protein
VGLSEGDGANGRRRDWVDAADDEESAQTVHCTQLNRLEDQPLAAVLGQVRFHRSLATLSKLLLNDVPHAIGLDMLGYLGAQSHKPSDFAGWDVLELGLGEDTFIGSCKLFLDSSVESSRCFCALFVETFAQGPSHSQSFGVDSQRTLNSHFLAVGEVDESLIELSAFLDDPVDFSLVLGCVRARHSDELAIFGHA